MNPMDKETLDAFAAFLTKEFRQLKHFTGAEVAKWSVNEFKVTLHVYNRGEEKKLFFDVREILENKYHFSHLFENALEQLKAT